MSGGHLPDFSAADALNDPIVDWGFGSTLIPTTPVPVTVLEPTDPPNTEAPGGTPGSRVNATVVYDPAAKRLLARAWGETDLGYVATATLQPSACTMEIHDEDGIVTIVSGRDDPVDTYHVRLSFAEVHLKPTVAYFVVIQLETVTGAVLGPRVIPFEVW